MSNTLSSRPDLPALQLGCWSRWLLAVAVLGGPLVAVLGGYLSPSIHADGAASIAANAAANPPTNAAHLAAFAAASFLLPLSAAGLARLAYPGSPRLALLAGAVGVLGWLPYAALTAEDDLAAVMARSAGLPGSASYAALYDRFAATPVELTFTVVYIVGHLVGYVLLGAALLRTRAVPSWAGWAFVVSSPLTIAAFVLPGRPLVVGYIAITLTVIASVPAALATLRPRTTPAHR